MTAAELRNFAAAMAIAYAQHPTGVLAAEVLRLLGDTERMRGVVLESVELCKQFVAAGRDFDGAEPAAVAAWVAAVDAYRAADEAAKRG